jgi:hypothetical protein
LLACEHPAVTKDAGRSGSVRILPPFLLNPLISLENDNVELIDILIELYASLSHLWSLG